MDSGGAVMAFKVCRFCMVFFILVILLGQPVSSNAEGYIIGAGDTLQVSVWGVDQLNFTAKVRPDGVITVPSIGEVTAVGFQPKDLETNLFEKLKKTVKNPIVTVSVTGITNSKVYIFGGGVKSGIFNLDRKTTLLQILCNLGGGIKNADLKSAYVLRNSVKMKTDFYNLFITGETSEDIPIESNDVIFIPRLGDKNIYVLGAVEKPSAIEYREGMTVMEAILKAGGFTKFADQNDTVIARKENGKTVSIAVKAKELFNKADLSQNFELNPGDYVLVKESLF